MSVKERPHYTLLAKTLAAWIESQSDKWWFVDGDPLLTSVVDFPCPGDELAPMIRKIGKPLLLQNKNRGSAANGESVEGNRLDELSDTNNRRHQKILLLSWIDSDTKSPAKRLRNLTQQNGKNSQAEARVEQEVAKGPPGEAITHRASMSCPTLPSQSACCPPRSRLPGRPPA